MLLWQKILFLTIIRRSPIIFSMDNEHTDQSLEGMDLHRILIIPVRTGLARLEEYVEGIVDPAFRMFLSSLIDQEKERVDELDEVFFDSGFPVVTDSHQVSELVSRVADIVENPLDLSGSRALLNDLLKRNNAAIELFSSLLQIIADSILRADIESFRSEVQKHQRMIEDRIALENLLSR